MNWKFIKAFPKFAIVVGVFIASTCLFGIWWMSHSKKPAQAQAAPVRQSEPVPQDATPDVQQQAIAQKAASLPAKMGWLALVGSDLWDISTGELIFRNWLGGIPQKLFYQRETNRLMAQTDRGVIRLGLDGSRDGVLGEDSPPAFTHDGKQAMFVRAGDVWVADVDWKGFRFTNERQATKLGQFNAQFFAANIMMGSEKALVVRNQNQLVRVDLLTGDVKPINLPLGNLAKRRSPDGRFLVGDEPKNIYAFDVEAADAHNFPTGRDRLVDYQWLDNNRCAFIVAAKGVGLYDRKKNVVEEVTALPMQCNKIAGPSPDGRYVLCAGRQGLVIVDVTGKKAENFGTPAQDFEWVNENTLIYSRDVPDMSVRGTWLRTMGSPERRITAEPYVVNREGGGAFAVMGEVNLVLFATQSGLFRMKPDGSDLREVGKLSDPAQIIQAVKSWES